MPDITSNLELYLKLDDQSGADSSGHARTATPVSGSGSTWPKIYMAGQVGSALSFHALSNQFLTIPSLASAMGDNATFCCWVKRIDATPAFDQLTGFGHLGPLITNGGTHYPFTNGLGYFGFFRASNNTTVDRISAVNLPAGVDRTQWHWLCISTAPGANGWNLYINNVLVTSATGITGVYYDADQWTIGKTSDPTFGDYYFDGALDEVRIYSRTLSAADRAAVMAYIDPTAPAPFGSVVAPSCHFGLMTFIPLSENNAEIGVGTEDINRFNPPSTFTWDNWLDSAARMGARHVFMTTKHCDGLTLWPSTVSNGHSIQNVSGAIHTRDLVNEFCIGARARNMDPSFYFAVGDNYLFVQNSNGYGGNYATKIVGQLTELMAYNPKFVVGDAWGDWWSGKGFPTFTDLSIDTCYKPIKTILPTCLFGINNHDDAYGDFRIYEETIEGEPAAGNSFPTMCWRVMPRVDPQKIQRWFTHSDTLTEPYQPALQLARAVQQRMLTRNYVMAHNYSIGPDGKLTPDLAAIANQVGSGGDAITSLDNSGWPGLNT